MSVAINTNINSFYLSPELPESITFQLQNTGGTGTVYVYVTGEIVYQNTMTAYTNKIHLYDIQTIIEEAIRQNNNAAAMCKVKVTEGSDSAETGIFVVLISDSLVGSTASWLQAHFLTRRKAFRCSRTGVQYLSYYVASGETVTHKIKAWIQNSSGNITCETWTQSNNTTGGGLTRETININTIQQHWQNNKLLAFEVERGENRKIMFFVTDEEPTLRMLFMNGFNVPEYAELSCIISTKNKMEAGTAEMLRKKQKYDIQNEEKFDVETAAMSEEDAMWLSQIFLSRYVAVKQNGSYREVLIDGEGDVSNSDNTINRVKFSYEFANNVRYI